MLTQNLPLALTFDDVLLVPQHSTVLPRDVDVTTRFGRLVMRLPIVSAAMDTVTGADMAIAMAQLGGLGVVHKNQSIDDQAAAVEAAAKVEPGRRATLGQHGRLAVGAGIGAGGDRNERVAALVNAGAEVIVVDSAHGHAEGVIQSVAYVREAYPDVVLVGGNVATPEAADALFDAGADVVKVGIGPGSICTTRIVAGTGVPQLTAVSDVATVARARGKHLIADGGIRSSGDIAKAIGAGADMVMLGSMLAGTYETPGKIIEVHGHRFKAYRGMGSLQAMQAGSSDRYFQEADPDAGPVKLVPEGIVGRVPLRGKVEEVIFQLEGGVRAAMGYSGCGTINDMQARARFVRITGSGLRESHVHDVEQTETAPNYSR